MLNVLRVRFGVLLNKWVSKVRLEGVGFGR